MAAEPLQLVVQAGEEIVCPGCGEVLLTFAEDVYGVEGFERAVLPACIGCIGEVARTACVTCGSYWARVAGRPGPADERLAPRIHLRSGSWVGWRGIGGE